MKPPKIGPKKEILGPMENPCTSIDKLLPAHLAERAVENIKNLYLNNSIKGFSRNAIENLSIIIVEFFKKCISKHLREGTMYLIIKNHDIFIGCAGLTLIKKHRAINFVVEQILCSLENFLKDKDENFVKEVFAGRVSNDSWKSSFIDVVRQDISKYANIIGQLYHIHKFENNKKERCAIVFIRKMLYYDFNNAIEWIQRFNSIDLNKFVDAKINTVPLSDFVLVERTSKKLYDMYLNGRFSEFSSCISDFYYQCENEWFRCATMELIYCTHLKLSNLENYDTSVVIFHILITLMVFLREMGNEFRNKVLSIKVSDDLWNKSFKIVIQQTRKACFRVIDMIFHILQPESGTRKDIINESVRELLSNEKTLNNGIEKVQQFEIKLENLKITKTEEIDEVEPWIQNVKNLHNEIQKLNYDPLKIEKVLEKFFNNQIDRKSNEIGAFFEDRSLHKHENSSFTTCSMEFLRPSTMELISMIDLTNENSRDCRFNICEQYHNAVRGDVKKFTVAVTDDVWIKAWHRCFEIEQLREKFAYLESLFRIGNRENDEREDAIFDGIRGMISKTETFETAIKWMNNFSLKRLKEEHFGHAVIYSCLFPDGSQTFFNSFKKPEDRIYFVKTLDELMYKTKMNTLPTYIGEEKKAFTVEKLLKKICEMCEKHNIDMKEHNLYACEELYIQTIINKFKCWDRSYFELYVLEDFKNREDKYKLLFLQSLIQLKQEEYAFCWAKYFEISDSELPKELKSCLIADINVQKFKKQLAKKVCRRFLFFKTAKKFQLLVEKDDTEICKFWGKSYKFITVVTRKGLKRFVKKCFIKSKPKILGIDAESGKSEEMTVLQLATDKWTCLIHIQRIFDKFSEKEWISIFELFFDPDITRIGFSFKSDYTFFVKRFEFLKDLLREQNRSVLCLQKLTRYILKDKNIVAKIFCNEIFEKHGLAILAKAVNNITMDKTEQNSEWANEYLNQFQKIYAVGDAVIVVWLKNEIEKSLTRNFPDRVDDIMKNGYVYYGCES